MVTVEEASRSARSTLLKRMGVETYPCAEEHWDEWKRCKEDIVYFIEQYVKTYDPREEEGNRWVAFKLWPKQIEYVHWLAERYKSNQACVCRKCRDVGATWLTICFCTHIWLFEKDAKVALGSRKDELVDSKGNPDALFSKVREIIKGLPSWMRPPHIDNEKKLVNEWNGSVMNGEAGDQMGTGGRCQPLDAKILTPTGWVTMADVSIGMEVVGADGKPTLVTGVYDQGVESIYAVEFKDGVVVECTHDHLWQVTDRYHRRANKAGRKTAPHLIVPTSHFAEATVRNVGGTNERLEFQVPVVRPIEFKEGDLPLDPYLVGSLLGDGSVSQSKSSPGFTTADAETLDELASRLPKGCSIKSDGSQYSYRLVDDRGKSGVRVQSPIKKALKELGMMGQTAYNKSVPDVYKFSSPETRLEVLRGLLDTDGWVTLRGRASNTCKVCFCSVSEKLARDVVFIVQSLGGTATIGTRPGGRRTFPGGREYDTVMSYQLVIAMPVGMNPFKLGRKAEKYRDRAQYPPTRWIKSVKPAGEKPVRCLTVAADDSLYVTEGCVVTHNSSIYFIDEFAKVERSQKVLAAVEDNSKFRIYVSTPEGLANEFGRMIVEEPHPVFAFSYKDDPRRNRWVIVEGSWSVEKTKQPDGAFANTWTLSKGSRIVEEGQGHGPAGAVYPYYEVEKVQRHPVNLAQEVDGDPFASMTDAVCPSEWIQAAMNASLTARGALLGGLDLGGGTRPSTVFAVRQGPVCKGVFRRSGPVGTAVKSLVETISNAKLKIEAVYYDAAGDTGRGFADAVKKWEKLPFVLKPFLGQKPPTRRVWPDGKRSCDLFLNIRAEAWWCFRERLRKTWENMNIGAEHPEDECCQLPEDANLATELAMVQFQDTETGKRKIESKAHMRDRGVKSPDSADAVVMCYFAQEQAKQIRGRFDRR